MASRRLGNVYPYPPWNRAEWAPGAAAVPMYHHVGKHLIPDTDPHVTEIHLGHFDEYRLVSHQGEFHALIPLGVPGDPNRNFTKLRRSGDGWQLWASTDPLIQTRLTPETSDASLLLRAVAAPAQSMSLSRAAPPADAATRWFVQESLTVKQIENHGFLWQIRSPTINVSLRIYFMAFLHREYALESAMLGTLFGWPSLHELTPYHELPRGENPHDVRVVQRQGKRVRLDGFLQRLLVHEEEVLEIIARPPLNTDPIHAHNVAMLRRYQLQASGRNTLLLDPVFGALVLDRDVRMPYRLVYHDPQIVVDPYSQRVQMLAMRFSPPYIGRAFTNDAVARLLRLQQHDLLTPSEWYRVRA